MNLQWLIYFQTIAELENYTQATKKLHVSQSNLSHAMRSLEEKLGVELFEKDGRNIRLSKYGEIFLPYVNKTLDSLDEGIAKLKEFLDPNTGTIELAGFPSVAQFSTDLMIRYQSETNRYDVHFQYAQIGWYEIHELIVSGKIDLCIATKFEEPEVAGTYIGDHPLVVIVPENHYLASRERVDLRELQDENFIGFNQNGQLAPMLQKTFASLGIEPRVVSRTPSDLIIYGLVAGGRGVSVVPFPLTHYAPFGTKLLCIENDIPKRRLYLQWNKEKFLPPAARYFRDYVIRSEEVFTQYFKRVNIGPETIGG
ncbi:LysR family transcriptional regulator [Acidaminococcus intestini]|uniref:LysR family transcriptional regulator n=1 Tax=Acidaminococcus intestini TaxID=187327 RepID=UPI0039F56D59